ncbi:phosphopantetheine-binding protein [Saccharopolyspora flava]|uniref:Phosphopantetheine attachment site n=1 Tax=Saccharopolyspora flava TaxID=95161 RepID=A0A1I6TMZ8_9PSEU|nr:phosphopantetheine-binding protein [Saccharopolyspora flava]SFS90367.1 Phosphopantetheine attachment site [Saccharopolyspora flava]
MDRTTKITQFIEERCLVEFGTDVTPQDDLFKTGVLDSFGYVQLMAFLEQEFALDIDHEDMLTNVLVSLESIDGYVAAKLGQ